MNCKPGDLAVIVDGDDCPQNLGRFVTVVEWVPAFIPYCAPDGSEFMGDNVAGWSVRAQSSLVTQNINGEYYLNDKYAVLDDRDLRPIRPSEEPDEMLRLVGKPERVTA